MTTTELNGLKNRIIEASTTAFTAIQSAMEADAETISMANAQIQTLTRQLTAANAEVTALRRAPAPTNPVTAPRASAPVSMDFTRQPGIPATLPVVRFLSKSSSMGGLANVRAQMNDLGINAKRMRLEGSTYSPSNDVIVINWGGGFELPAGMSGFTGKHLNKLSAVKIAASKLKTFQKLKDNSELQGSIPAFSTTIGGADWDVVYARKDLYGHSGEGIVVCPRGTTLPQAPLYVEGLNIKHEYRVHTVNGYTKIQKKARLGTETANMEVRNLEGGWTFVNTFTLGDRGRNELHDLSIKTLEVLGLDFGAVDVVRTSENTWKILEVNTAPGVTAESNIEWYTKALISPRA